ncbi:hypothetical protein [Endozoicomonas sp. 4G]|uniref:hypothetical protein n=1 Tax=Endozoicomonas sp. 4G TaxID=2872754 RepID=UPI0020784F7F|nr:hypothetical protein [Endozoicomonas sp. 4G]
MTNPVSSGRTPVLPTSERPGNDSGSKAEHALTRCRAIKGQLSIILAKEALPELPEPPLQSRFLNGGKRLEFRTVEASPSWFGSLMFAPTSSITKASEAEILAELKEMDERIHKDYQRICQLHRQLRVILNSVSVAEASLGQVIPRHDQALRSQHQGQQAIEVRANELLDEFGTLNETFLAEIQKREQAHSQADDQNPPGSFYKVLVAKVRSLENELRHKALMIEVKNQKVRELDMTVQGLTQLAKYSDKQMLQALNEQHRMGRVDQLASTLKIDLSESERRINIFQGAVDKIQNARTKQAQRADQLEFQLNQLTAQLRDQREMEAKVSELGLENTRLQRQLQTAQASSTSTSEVLENLAALQHKSDHLETLTKSQAKDLKKIRSERDQARARFAAVEEQLKKHCAEMNQVTDETKKAEKGLKQLDAQIQKLQIKLAEEREHNDKLQADKVSSDTELRQLRSQFANQVRGARIQASIANIQLNKELEEKKAEYEKESAHYRELSTQLDALSLAMKKESEKASRYLAKSQRLEEELTLAQERFSELESQKTQLEQQLEDTQTRIKGANGRVSALEVRLSQQQTELEQLRATGVELKTSKEKLAQIKTDLRQTRSLLQKTTMAEQSAREALQKKEEETRTWITQSRQWNNARATLEGQVETLKAELRTLSEDKSKAEEELSQQAGNVEVLRKKLLALNTKMQLASNQSQSDQSSQKQRIELLTVQVTELEHQKREAEETLLASEARFEQDYSQSEHRVSELTQQLIALKAELSNATEAQQRARSEAALAKSERKKFESESVRLGQQVDTLTKEVCQLTDEQSRVKMQLENERLELRSEVATLREKATKADTIEQELQLKHKVICDQKAQLSQMERTLKTQLGKLRQDLDESRQKLDEEEAAKLAFQLDYNAAKSQLEQLQKKYAEAMADIDRLKVLPENSEQAQGLGSGFDFQESGVGFDDHGAYVSLGTSTQQPASLAQPLATVDEASLSDPRMTGSQGVSRFEYQDLMRKKKALDEQMSELRQALRTAQNNERAHKKRASQAAWELRDISKQLKEVKAESEQFARIASDQKEEQKKWREEVSRLNKAKAQFELEKQTQLDEAAEFAEDTVRRNAVLKTDVKHLRTKVDDLEHRLERDMPSVMQKNQDLSQQNEVLKKAFLDVVGLFREKLSDVDQAELEDRLLEMQATLLPLHT